MQTPPRAGALPGSLTALVLSLATLACGGASNDGAEGKAAETPAKADATKAGDVKTDEAKAGDAKADEVKAGDVKAGDVDAGDVKADGGAPPPGTDETGGTGPGPAASGAPPAADETGADETAGTTGGPVDVDALLKEIKGKKTKDARAQAAVAEAEAAGADPVALAKALVSRGQALYSEPDRAKSFFELANDKDPKSPAAAFELAKQAAIVGEVEEAKTWLTVVHERKGKKLLKQIDFDPMWEILKDDPDVRAMLK